MSVEPFTSKNVIDHSDQRHLSNYYKIGLYASKVKVKPTMLLMTTVPLFHRLRHFEIARF